jgi:hypothetical protein
MRLLASIALSLCCLSASCLAAAEERISSPDLTSLGPEPSGPWIYEIRCDKQHQALTISHGYYLPADFKPSPQTGWEFRLDPDLMVEWKTINEQTFRIPSVKKQYRCKLKGGDYQVTVEAHVSNPNVMGQGGMDDPFVAATVVRNGQLLLPRQGFQSSSLGGVKRLVFHEPTRTLDVLVETTSPRPLRFERYLRFDAAPWGDLGSLTYDQ